MPKNVRNRIRRRTEGMRGEEADRGASLIEYVGLVIIIAAIVLAVRALNLNTAISTAVQNAVNSILGTG